MPVFKEPNCPLKIVLLTESSIIVSIILTHYAGNFGGLIGASIAMLLSIVVMWYLIDMYGDLLFTDPKHQYDVNEIESKKNQVFHYKPS